jgi:hypothetical protein
MLVDSVTLVLLVVVVASVFALALVVPSGRLNLFVAVLLVRAEAHCVTLAGSFFCIFCRADKGARKGGKTNKKPLNTV